MTRHRRVLAAIAGAAIASLTVIVPATPAMADPALTVNVDPPGVEGGRATITGSAQMSNPLGLDQVTAVSITVSPHDHAGRTETCDGCGADLSQSQTSFSFATPYLGYNGPYDVTVDVSGKKVLNSLLNGAAVSTRATTGLNIEVAPAPPADLIAVVNPDHSVTVSWARNSEPDLVGYQVQRRSPGAGNYGSVGPSIDQSDGQRVPWTDTSTAGGGQFEYLVVAVRPDGNGAVSERATSASNAAGVSVPVPPGSPAAAGGPGAPGAPGGGAPGAIATTGPAGAFTTGSPPPLDLSSFLTGGGGAPPRVSVPGGVTLPDGTFSPTLPFGARNDGLGADSVEVLGHSTARRTLFLPIAAGLLLCMLAMHLRRFNRRVLAPPVEP